MSGFERRHVTEHRTAMVFAGASEDLHVQVRTLELILGDLQYA